MAHTKLPILENYQDTPRLISITPARDRHSRTAFSWAPQNSVLDNAMRSTRAQATQMASDSGRQDYTVMAVQ